MLACSKAILHWLAAVVFGVLVAALVAAVGLTPASPVETAAAVVCIQLLTFHYEQRRCPCPNGEEGEDDA